MSIYEHHGLRDFVLALDYKQLLRGGTSASAEAMTARVRRSSAATDSQAGFALLMRFNLDSWSERCR
jgi:hypothetical protein